LSRSVNKQKSLAGEFLAGHGMDHRQVDMAECMEAFIGEMKKGLAQENGSSLQMLPTFLDAENPLPMDKPVAVIDMGGTNFRTGVLVFRKNGKREIFNFSQYPVPGSDPDQSSDSFYNQIADAAAPLLKGSVDTIGFCFSYPMEMTRNHDGKILMCTKSLRAEAVKGSLLSAGLARSLQERHSSAAPKIVLINDAIAALLSGKAAGLTRSFSANIGFILGTGMNCAYREKNENIIKVSDLENNKYQIINTEAGLFDKAVRGDLDRLYDSESPNPGKLLFEKMIGGGYFAGLIRTVMLAAGREGLFSDYFSEAVLKYRNITTEDLNDFLKAPLSSSLIADFLARDQNEKNELLFFIISELIERGAKYAAVMLSSVIKQTGAGQDPEKPVCISANGTTFYKLRNLKERIDYYLKGFCTDIFGCHYAFAEVKNAPLVGAGVAALCSGVYHTG